MPTFLSDPPQTIYLLLLAAVILAGLVWLNRRERRALYVFLGVLGVTALVVLVDRLLESPREEAVRRVHAMMEAADRRDPDAFAGQLADKVTYVGEQSPEEFTREQLRSHHFWSLLRQFNVHVAAWNFALLERPDENTVVIGFMAKGELPDRKQLHYHFRATFTRQGDGQMKLSRLESFDPMSHNKRVGVRGL
jgi:hypothetical protein